MQYTLNKTNKFLANKVPSYSMQEDMFPELNKEIKNDLNTTAILNEVNICNRSWDKVKNILLDSQLDDSFIPVNKVVVKSEEEIKLALLREEKRLYQNLVNNTILKLSERWEKWKEDYIEFHGEDTFNRLYTFPKSLDKDGNEIEEDSDLEDEFEEEEDENEQENEYFNDYWY